MSKVLIDENVLIRLIKGAVEGMDCGLCPAASGCYDGSEIRCTEAIYKAVTGERI